MLKHQEDEMEFTKEIFTSTDAKHEMILEDQNHCCLCGTKLRFQHKVDYMTLKIEEEASCPSCHIQLRKREATLQ